MFSKIDKYSINAAKKYLYDKLIPRDQKNEEERGKRKKYRGASENSWR